MKRCWLFHKWGAWITTGRYEIRSNLFRDHPLIGEEVRQERTCARCGMLQARTVRT